MKQIDLTKGNIAPGLIKLALPIMGTSFIQMAYNMTDLYWIGALGGAAATAVATAGFFPWFAMGLITIPKVAAEALVSRAVGKKSDDTNIIVGTLIKFTVLAGLIYGIIIFFGRGLFISFLNIKSQVIIDAAMDYSAIISFSYILFFINPILSSIFNAAGSSVVPFVFNMCGLVLNMILDPIMIHGFIGRPLGVIGAAIATVISQLVVTVLFAFFIYKNKHSILFHGFKLFRAIDVHKLKEIIRVGFPVGLQSMSFTIIAIFIARIIADFGDIGIGIQRIGSQIESITWMTASGFSAAISAFIGQNLGAKHYDRIRKGFWIAYGTMALVGLLTSALLFIFPEEIFSVFLKDPVEIREGGIYLLILSYSQFFMCIEIVTNGAFYGLGETIYPSVNSTVFTALRIPAAYILSRFMGLQGVWWAISISSMIKGVLITILFLKKGMPKTYKSEQF